MSEQRIDLLLKALSEQEVDFIVIGAVAVGWHGYVRGTKDLDIVPDPERANCERLARALERLDATVEGAGELEDDALPSPTDPDALASGGNWVLRTRHGLLDVMQHMGDRALWPRLQAAAIEDEIVGITVRICSYEDLLALKRESGRPSDLDDIERLREARGEG